MAYVLPESILCQQVCSTCKKYLSYPPTKIYVNGHVKCGRCSSPDDDGVVSTYETLAKTMLFPCVNRYEGCLKVLHYADVKEHERCCEGTVVNCPICPETPCGSVLCLLHHFKIKHPQDILSERKTRCHATQSFAQFRVWFSAEDQESFQLGRTYTENCLGINSVLDETVTNSLFYVVPVYLTSIICNLVFVYNLPLLKIEHFPPKPLEECQKRDLRKIYLDNDFKRKCNISEQTAFKVSNCGKKLSYNEISIQITCDFCENLFATSGLLKEIYHNSECYVCGTCYSRGVTKNLNNDGKDLKEFDKSVGYQLPNFYCKFGCKKFCRSGELLTHEDQCTNNEKRSLSTEEYVKSLFENEYITGQKYTKENVMIMEPNKMSGKGKIFVATRDHFKCVIKYEVEKSLSRCFFHVEHAYNPSAYYISIHKWEDQMYSEEYNDFSMKIGDLGKPSLFAVILKEIQDDLEIFYDV